MVSFIRHLVSQHFGRIIATVEVDTDDGGVVRLHTEPALTQTIDFTFSVKALMARAATNQSWLELIIRLAVAQAHGRCRKLPSACTASPDSLRVDLQPWLGDLFLSPYGGATLGINNAGQHIGHRPCQRRSTARRLL